MGDAGLTGSSPAEFPKYFDATYTDKATTRKQPPAGMHPYWHNVRKRGHMQKQSTGDGSTTYQNSPGSKTQPFTDDSRPKKHTSGDSHFEVARLTAGAAINAIHDEGGGTYSTVPSPGVSQKVHGNEDENGCHQLPSRI